MENRKRQFGRLVGGDVRWALLEGFRKGFLGYTPDFSIGEYAAYGLERRCDAGSGRARPEIDALEFRPSPQLLPGRTYRVRFNGDLVRDRRTGRGIDANHLPPWLPARTSGDCIEGGMFHSWFAVTRA